MYDQNQCSTTDVLRQGMTPAELWRQAEKARFAADLAQLRGNRLDFLEARKAFLLAQAAAYQATHRKGGRR